MKKCGIHDRCRTGVWHWQVRHYPGVSTRGVPNKWVKRPEPTSKKPGRLIYGLDLLIVRFSNAQLFHMADKSSVVPRYPRKHRTLTVSIPSRKNNSFSKFVNYVVPYLSQVKLTLAFLAKCRSRFCVPTVGE